MAQSRPCSRSRPLTGRRSAASVSPLPRRRRRGRRRVPRYGGCTTRRCRPGPGAAVEELEADLDRECEWLISEAVLPADLVLRNREVAAVALRPWTPVFTHGDLQLAHVFVDRDDAITGVIDWSEASRGDALYDLASLTLGQRSTSTTCSPVMAPRSTAT